MSNFTIHAVVDGTEYTAEREGNGSPWWIREADTNGFLFSVAHLGGTLEAATLERLVEIYLAGRRHGFADGERYGATQVRAQLHKLLGVDELLDTLTDIAVSIREAGGVRR